MSPAVVPPPAARRLHVHHPCEWPAAPWLSRAAVLLALLTLLLPAAASAGRLDARARTALARVRAGRDSLETMRRQGVAVDRHGALDVIVLGSVTRAELEAAGARVRTALPGLFTASVPADAAERVAALPGVTSVRGGAPCAPEAAAGIVSTGVTLLRGSGPAFGGLDGRGVLVGIVDSGVDVDHADFRDSTGATRFVSIWDQVTAGTGAPGYPYGKSWSAAQIDAGLCTEADSSGHGTHVAGILAGDGSQTGGGTPAFAYAGMAPRADLIAVKTDFLTPEVLDGIQYVFDQAAARGQSAVVNLSLGSHYGSHDGASAFEQGVSALVGPGRIVVKSAGNDRGSPIHAQVFATPGGAAVTLSVTGSLAGRHFAVDGYYAGTERLRVRVTTPGGAVIGPLVLNSENAPWPGQVTANGTVYVAHDSLDAAHRNIYLEVYSETANRSMNGTWTLTLFADVLGAANGEVDLWRYAAATGLTASFVNGNLPTQELISEPGNAADVITAGAWVTSDTWPGCNGVTGAYAGTPSPGNLAPFSSPGPTRDGRLKPDLTAPGTAIESAASHDLPPVCPAPPAVSEYLDDGLNHRVFAGTSTAAPHVAGAVALLLQKYGPLTPAQALARLRESAVLDGFTGATPSRDWGHGKLALGDLLDPEVQVLAPNGGEIRVVDDPLTLEWDARDSLGDVVSVDLQLSRSGASGPFEDIASGVANTGRHVWTVTGPATATGGAFLRVVAHDTHANAGSDTSDAGFTIGLAGLAVDGPAPATFALAPPRPNPAVRDAGFDFVVARPARVRLSICDLQGRTVAVLADGVFEAGRHHASWAARASRAPAASGLYFVRYETPAGVFVERFVMIR